MAKQNNIRKKALDFARKQQWEKALVEFKRLADIERHNPNLFNEIGDVHLKIGDKREAFKSFHEAVDAYSRVGLDNNAVAVCKKILRLNPTDYVVFGKLARLRQKQGFHKEAISYSLTFFERVVDGTGVPPEHLRELVVELSLATDDASDVLERAAEYLMRCQFNEDAGAVLEKLDRLYASQGMSDKRAENRKLMESIGHIPSTPVDAHPERLETVESHREKTGDFPDERETEFSGSIPPHIRTDQADHDAHDFGVVEIGGGADPATDLAAEPTQPTQPAEVVPTNSSPDGTEAGLAARRSEPASQATNDGDPDAMSSSSKGPSTNVKEYVIPCDEVVDPDDGASEKNDEEFVPVSDIFDQFTSEVKADVEEGDHRSHYDLGMAYLEMDLLAEAIREFQFAANSTLYQVRSLEMIGRCFLKQNQPQLAIKQLTRGLSLVETDDRDTLGIKYNLGLAYEMVGDIENAKSFFEDVYVVDVTFRDIEEKINKYNP